VQSGGSKPEEGKDLSDASPRARFAIGLIAFFMFEWGHSSARCVAHALRAPGIIVMGTREGAKPHHKRTRGRTEHRSKSLIVNRKIVIFSR